ncbi:MAG: rod shape-determining protein RodA [Bacteroidales bacterium]|nr:rod shape-determining protein RodA [Bacteroidales bacterium]
MPLFENKLRKQSRIDWILVILYLSLVIIGWINIYSAVYDEQHQNIVDFSQQYGKQLIWIITAIILALVVILLDSKFYSTFAYPIYAGTLLLLIAVLLVGEEIAGSRSWFVIGNIRIQPTEFAKFATSLAVARYLSMFNVDISKLKTKIKLLLIITLPAGLILLQNDAGSALVYLSFLIVFYREGFSERLFIIGGSLILLFLATLLFNQWYVMIALGLIALLFIVFTKKSLKNIAIILVVLVISLGAVYSTKYVFNNVLERHQRTRINVLLGKESDPQGAEYNVNQSKIAIGSGGFAGKGFLEGTQTKFNFVPEQSTDFIFCTIGEEWGFIGSFIIIALYVLLLFRIINLAERQRSDFSRIYGYGLASVLLFHFVVNLGMTIGLLPVIGIPLPFISYGGSSLWGFTVLLFIFIKLDANHQELF